MHGVEVVPRAQQMRQAAREAFVKVDEDDKVRRALEHCSPPERGPFLQRNTVYYWRKYPREANPCRWHGPGLVIGNADQRAKIWVAVGYKVVRCAPEQLRRATMDQEGALKPVSPDLIETTRAKGGVLSGTWTSHMKELHLKNQTWGPNELVRTLDYHKD